MSVTGKDLPKEAVILATLDKASHQAIERARSDLAPIVTSQVPRGRTGSLEHALEPRAQKTPWGSALVVGPRRGAHHASGPTIAQVVRWVTRGTGLERQGPGAKAPLHSPRWLYGAEMILPGGKARLTVRGQKANPFLERIRSIGTPRVERALKQGAEDAARLLARKVAG